MADSLNQMAAQSGSEPTPSGKVETEEKHLPVISSIKGLLSKKTDRPDRDLTHEALIGLPHSCQWHNDKIMVLHSGRS